MTRRDVVDLSFWVAGDAALGYLFSAGIWWWAILGAGLGALGWSTTRTPNLGPR